MQFTLAALLSLSATTLAAAIPRSTTGSWDVSVTRAGYANGYKSTTVSATYTNDNIAEGITSTCTSVFNPAASPSASESCDNESFSYTYEDDVITLTQTVQLDEVTTVSGSAPLTLTLGSTGRSSSGSATVEATTAVA
ncbi:hypothetical protein P153DRAFT_357764 [Dothidotthia symphoricarpi CBS 119687]|uniref:AA1-like domain-containing protein n=1 Tax=Dothidotthia symphoricarpi CBS 119687 TaxID=1392245 RepID=A0A6A6A9C7_9PLEO|nr:uncharacterized protein P153DRAFT_357764 [Dothidotthia symphoricarpi CBS 119687]KAF2128409.1 hypothetical protein P153DRAFT_357764 [Dothidotthia symphoricarpi CBS 119687]